MKALIVDDSKVVRSVSNKILVELGFVCEQAEDGKEALQKVADKQYDLILLDWNMPIMNGIDFLSASKEGGFLQETKVVLCTTESEIDKIVEALTKGASEYIMKPFTKEILEDKLKIIGLL